MQSLAELLCETLDQSKALEINLIDLAGKSDMADYLLIASGNSARHVGALARQVLGLLSEQGIKGLRPEGGNRDEWVVIDAHDIIIHLFSPEMRKYYDLDKMWQDIHIARALPLNAEDSAGDPDHV